MTDRTLCSIPGVGRAPGEVDLVLRPGGRFRYLEQSLGIEPRVQRWRRLNPIQWVLGDGFCLELDVPAIVGIRPYTDVRGDLFEMERVPRTHGTKYRGVAVKCPT